MPLLSPLVDGEGSPGARRIALALVLLATAALVVAPWRGHVDDIDAQIYQVVARNMVADHAWLDLRYLPDVWPRFREHLPFSFWPATATIRLFGERAVNWLYALTTIAMVWRTASIATRVYGGWAGVVAALVLGSCESIWHYGGRFLMEPPLLFFATAAAGAALLPRPRWGSAALHGAIAVLIKGPFGLLPLGCVVLARASAESSLRVLIGGSFVLFAATVPAAVFLLWDLRWGGGTWWSGYFQDRILGWAGGASAAGGIAYRWLPLSVIARRFWPGLPLASYGIWRARNDRQLRPLAAACVLGAILLCFPERKWGNHAYVLFPLLAILAGAAVKPHLDRVLTPARQRRVAGLLAGVTAAAWVLSLAGFGRLVLQPPCLASAEFARELGGLPPGTPVTVVAPGVDWLLIGPLAAERRLVPVPSSALPAEEGASVAIVRDGVPVHPPWAEKARARGWSLVRR